MTMMVNSALRMHPEEFQIGVGSGAAAAHMALSNGEISSTSQAVKNASIVTAIRARISHHAPLQFNHKKWPVAVGYTCAKELMRCVQVPGGGAFNSKNTHQSCSGCEVPPLRDGEWLMLAGLCAYDVTTKTCTVHSATRIKKSTVNSSLLGPKDYVSVTKGQGLRLAAAPSSAFRVDSYTYVLIICVEERC